ncbi:hypothetical protein [Streptomyces mirabilis]|uniref:hypothetical protein n=1 Tax=Streptomyces mirabilis TaxID=68239 RepID=UPI0036EF649F
MRGINGHPVIETAARELADGDRLVLATDGAYEPHEEAGHDLYVELEDDELTGTARRFVDLAVETSRKGRPEHEHRYVDNEREQGLRPRKALVPHGCPRGSLRVGCGPPAGEPGRL